MDVVTLIQSRNRDVKFTASSQRRYYDLASTLCHRVVMLCHVISALRRTSNVCFFYLLYFNLAY